MNRFKIGIALCCTILCLSLTSCFDFLKDLEEALEITNLDPTSEEMDTFIYGKWKCIKAGQGTAEDIAGNEHADDSDSYGDNSLLEYITFTPSKITFHFSKPIPVRVYEGNTYTETEYGTEVVCDYNNMFYPCCSHPLELWYDQENGGEYLWNRFEDSIYTWGEMQFYGVENDNDEIERVDYMLFIHHSYITYELKKVE